LQKSKIRNNIFFSEIYFWTFFSDVLFEFFRILPWTQKPLKIEVYIFFLYNRQKSPIGIEFRIIFKYFKINIIIILLFIIHIYWDLYLQKPKKGVETISPPPFIIKFEFWQEKIFCFIMIKIWPNVNLYTKDQNMKWT